LFRYIIRRVLFSIPVLLISSVIVFVAIRANGDFTRTLALNPRADPEAIAEVRRSLGLDKSGPAQYWAWLTRFVQGDWGQSLLTGESVSKDIRNALWNTIVLGVTAIVFSLLIGLGIGVYSALRQYSLFDHISTGAAFLGLSIPNFWFGLMLQILFGYYLAKWLGLQDAVLPISGMFEPGTTGFNLLDRIRHLILPMLVLAVQIIAIYSRYIRASMLEVMHSDYMRTARAKGLSERRVIFKHGMRNALIPLTTQLALDLGLLAGGLIITEQIFSWPGMGKFFIEAMANGDYAQVLPWMMVVVATVILFNLIADILYALLDPRIRYA
jgi:peptide/nickel transport system permease protein